MDCGLGHFSQISIYLSRGSSCPHPRFFLSRLDPWWVGIPGLAMSPAASNLQDPWMNFQKAMKERNSEWCWVGVLLLLLLHLSFSFRGHSQWEDLHQFQKDTAGSTTSTRHRLLDLRRSREEEDPIRSSKPVSASFDSSSAFGGSSNILLCTTLLLFNIHSSTKTILIYTCFLLEIINQNIRFDSKICRIQGVSRLIYTWNHHNNHYW